MKVAIICLAHQRVASGVRMLSEYFAKLDADLFVHVDAKVSCEAYEGASVSPNVHILKERLPIYWGGFNTILAVVRAIEIARNCSDYDRYIFLTEDSIPLRSPSELIRCLAEDVEWIDANALPTDKWQRYERFYCLDMPPTSPRVGNPVEKFFTEEHINRIIRMQSLMALGKATIPHLFHGSAYWALSAQAISTVLESHFASEHLRRSFEFSLYPDEQYFHTILASAGRAKKRRSFMRADFSRPPYPYVFRTAEELYAEQRGSKCLFLRKVDLTKAEVNDYVSQLTQTP